MNMLANRNRISILNRLTALKVIPCHFLSVRQFPYPIIRHSVGSGAVTADFLVSWFVSF
jgi:hypothetical protein